MDTCSFRRKYKLSKIGTAITNSIAAYWYLTKAKKKTKENPMTDFKVQIKDSPYCTIDSSN
jgi:hypothetical protein